MRNKINNALLLFNRVQDGWINSEALFFKTMDYLKIKELVLRAEDLKAAYDEAVSCLLSFDSYKGLGIVSKYAFTLLEFKTADAKQKIVDALDVELQLINKEIKAATDEKTA